jgi:lipopolysaccharide/colanic/teichoic acid biosynthesis glycosyltransferase
MEQFTIPEQSLEHLPDNKSDIDRPTAESKPSTYNADPRDPALVDGGTLTWKVVDRKLQDAMSSSAPLQAIAHGIRTTRRIQRALDVLISAFCLLFFLPLFLFVAVAIKLDSPGSIFFYQERVGYCGASFRLYKFRSMVPDAELRQAELWADNERDGPVFKIKNDPRVTRVGHILRKYSIDELPQLFNVLKGDMSLVGPRPALPFEVAMYSPKQRQRLSAIPGITGLWQISGRADVSFEQSIELDLQYIRTQSIRLNLRIILLTIPKVLRGDGAY